MQSVTELHVSLRRIDDFLSTPEPPLPVHHTKAGESEPDGTVALRGADFDWSRPLGRGVRPKAHTAQVRRAGCARTHRRTKNNTPGGVGGAGRQAVCVCEGVGVCRAKALCPSSVRQWLR